MTAHHAPCHTVVHFGGHLRRVYPLNHHHKLSPADLQRLLGGKGFGLSRMTTEWDLPVPPGFTITTEACNEYFINGWPDGLDAEIQHHLEQLESQMGRRLGDPDDPMLVSVRSGAPISMPGMMDTILNLGLTPRSVAGLAKATDDRQFANDCHQRFLDMFRSIVMTEHVPEDPRQQLRLAVEAVFKSWNSERAVSYRAHEGIDHQLGTAVTIQAMVFGNRGPNSATGVMFTRNPATGKRSTYGDLLFGAQGEDVVAGTHETLPMNVLDERLPEVGSQLREFAEILEHHHADLCDIEFTVEDGTLWMLQVRVGKRSPQAALRMALEMAEDDSFPLTMAEAVERVASHLRNPPSRSFDRPAGAVVLTSGLGASPGIVSGEIATAADRAERTAAAGRPVILVRPETSPADVHGITHAAGILTATGGVVSHAAVVARGWGIPAVVGASEVEVRPDGISIGDTSLRTGDIITIDGSTGEVFEGNVSGRTEIVPEALTLLKWAVELGIEIHEDSPTMVAADPTSLKEVSRDDVLGVMAIKGFVSAESVARAIVTDPARVADLLDDLTADGHAEGSGPMIRLSTTGNRLADEILHGEQTRLGPKVAGEALDSFLTLDHRAKSIITRWQLKESPDGTMTANDHSKPDYDEAVITDLSTLTIEVGTWLEPLLADLTRLQRYRTRLDTAMEHIRDGDHRFMASPIVDSYHSVWFEIHEDLIRLAGSTRADETAAGRA